MDPDRFAMVNYGNRSDFQILLHITGDIEDEWGRELLFNDDFKNWSTFGLDSPLALAIKCYPYKIRTIYIFSSHSSLPFMSISSRFEFYRI